MLRSLVPPPVRAGGGGVHLVGPPFTVEPRRTVGDELGVALGEQRQLPPQPVDDVLRVGLLGRGLPRLLGVSLVPLLGVEVPELVEAVVRCGGRPRRRSRCGSICSPVPLFPCSRRDTLARARDTLARGVPDDRLPVLGRTVWPGETPVSWLVDALHGLPP